MLKLLRRVSEDSSGSARPGAVPARPVRTAHARGQPGPASRAENIWILKTHSNWRKDRQSLFSAGSRSYDRIEYVTPTARQEIYFDITDARPKISATLSPAVMKIAKPIELKVVQGLEESGKNLFDGRR